MMQYILKICVDACDDLLNRSIISNLLFCGLIFVPILSCIKSWWSELSLAGPDPLLYQTQSGSGSGQVRGDVLYQTHEFLGEMWC